MRTRSIPLTSSDSPQLTPKHSNRVPEGFYFRTICFLTTSKRKWQVLLPTSCRNSDFARHKYLYLRGTQHTCKCAGSLYLKHFNDALKSTPTLPAGRQGSLSLTSSEVRTQTHTRVMSVYSLQMATRNHLGCDASIEKQCPLTSFRLAGDPNDVSLLEEVKRRRVGPTSN